MFILRLLLIFLSLYLTPTPGVLASTIITSSPTEVDISKDFLLGAEGLKKNEKNSLRFGYFNGESWARITLKNPEEIKLSKLIYFETLTGRISLYEQDNKGSMIELMQSGSSIPYRTRKIKSIFTAFPIALNPHSEKSFFFKIISRHNFNSKVYVGTNETIEEKEEIKLSFLDFYAGGILCLVLYNFFIFLFLRDKNYLYYCLFSSSFMLPILTIHGLMDKLFQPSTFSFSHYLICFSSLALMAATVFTYHFIEIPKFLKNFVTIYKTIFIVALFIFIVGLTPFEDYTPAIYGRFIDILLLSANSMFIFNSIYLVKISSAAKYYLFSWAAILLSLICWFGMTFGFLPNNFFTQQSLLFANLGQMLILSLALAYRIHELTEQKLAAEEKALQKEKYQRLFRVLSHDIANSLTIINSYSKRLIKPKTLEETQQRSIEKIYFASENIKNILNNVREEGILSNRKKEMEKELTNVSEAIQAASMIFEEHLNHKRLELVINVDKDHHIWANRNCFLNNIVNNILSNAIKFSFENSKIEIFSRKNSDRISIHFKDCGRGIEADLIQEIFFSNHIISTKGTQEEAGHGFGSILMREYVELFGGTLEVNSQLSDGSTLRSGTEVIISFPLL